MAVLPDVLANLQARAERASDVSGHDVQVVVLPGPQSVTLTINGTVVSGPDRFDDAAAHSLDLALSEIENQTLVIVTDDDGSPRVVSFDELPPN